MDVRERVLTFKDVTLIDSFPKTFEKILALLIEDYYEFENKMIDSFKYVTLDYSNRVTHSKAYNNLLIKIGNMFTHIIDIIHKEIGFKIIVNGSPTFFILENIDPKLSKRTVTITHINKILIPFQTNTKGVPFWWESYNDIRINPRRFRLGNLENALLGLASSAIFLSMLSGTLETRLFTNIGIIPNKYDNNLFYF